MIIKSSYDYAYRKLTCRCKKTVRNKASRNKKLCKIQPLKLRELVEDYQRKIRVQNGFYEIKNG